jgi:GNAT superfamily N-acetyltransferase
MKRYAKENLQIRTARTADVPVILKFIFELAEYEGVRDLIQSTEESLNSALFQSKTAEALVAEMDGAPIGFAIWSYNFSTFTGRPTLYLDDLYVRKPFRSMGVGSGIFARLADIACEKGCARMDWYCLKTNAPGIAYYQKMGAAEIDWIRLYRLDRTRLETMRQPLQPPDACPDSNQ